MIFFRRCTFFGEKLKFGPKAKSPHAVRIFFFLDENWHHWKTFIAVFNTACDISLPLKPRLRTYQRGRDSLKILKTFFSETFLRTEKPIFGRAIYLANLMRAAVGFSLRKPLCIPILNGFKIFWGYGERQAHLERNRVSTMVSNAIGCSVTFFNAQTASIGRRHRDASAPTGKLPFHNASEVTFNAISVRQTRLNWVIGCAAVYSRQSPFRAITNPLPPPPLPPRL